MATLPSRNYLMQQIEEKVHLIDAMTGDTLDSFDPSDPNESALFQGRVYRIDEARMSPEDKSFAHFWSGYFYAYATMNRVSPVNSG